MYIPNHCIPPTSKKKKKKEKKGSKNKYNLVFKIISILLIISAVIASGFLIYFEILPILYLCLFIIIVGLIIFGIFMLLNNKRLKKWLRITISIPSVIMILITSINPEIYQTWLNM